MKAIPKGILLCAILIFSSAVLEASHFRFGHTTWRRVSGNTVEFTSTQAWRCDGVAPLSIDPGDGSGLIIGTVETLLDSTDCSGLCYRVIRYRVTHTYAGVGPYTAVLSSCCRIGALINAGNAAERMETIVDLRDGNQGSPVSSIPPILQFPTGGGTFTIPVADPDGDAVTCVMATSAQSGIPAVAAGLSLVGCTLVFANGAPSGSMWAVQVVLEEHRPQGVNHVALDFIIQICDPMGNQPPFCTCSDHKEYPYCPGEELSIWTCGVDPEGGVLNVSAMGLPAGATLTPASGPSPHCAQLKWTPPQSSANQVHVVTLIFTDTAGAQGYCSLTLKGSSAVILSESEVDCAGSALEIATPSAALASWILGRPQSRLLHFDECPGVNGVPTDMQFGHTFTFTPPFKIERAHLLVVLKATTSGSGGLAHNDSIGLEFKNPPGFKWSRHIGTRGAQIGLDPQDWTPGRCRSFSLNLSALPNPDNTFTNLIPSLMDGELDVYVQDDSCVDYMRLSIYPCKPWGYITNTASPAILQYQFNEPGTGSHANNTASHRFAPDAALVSQPAWRVASGRGVFDGALGAGYLDTGWDIDLSGSTTLMWWQKKRSSTPVQQGSFVFGTKSGGGLRCAIEDLPLGGLIFEASAFGRATSFGPALGQVGRWQHVALTIDDALGTVTVSTDGVPDPNVARFTPGTFAEQGDTMLVGEDGQSGRLMTNAFDIDDFRIYREAVSGPQLLVKMQSETPAASHYGSGCGGELEPIIGTSGDALVGNTSFGIEATNVPTTPGSLAVLLLATNSFSPGIPLPFGPGCELGVSPASLFTLPIPILNFCPAWRLPVPRNVGVLNAHIYTQVMVLEPTTNTITLSRSMDLNFQS